MNPDQNPHKEDNLRHLIFEYLCVYSKGEKCAAALKPHVQEIKVCVKFILVLEKD